MTPVADEKALKDEHGHEWPARLLIRDTKIHDDLGGLGQRIYTTAGAGYKKVEYVRADLLRPASAVAEAAGEKGCESCGGKGGSGYATTGHLAWDRCPRCLGMPSPASPAEGLTGTCPHGVTFNYVPGGNCICGQRIPDCASPSNEPEGTKTICDHGYDFESLRTEAALCTPACHFKAESEGAPSPASSNEAAEVSDAGMLLSVALSFAEEPRRRPSLGIPADTVDELYRALARLAKEVRLRCRPVAEVDARPDYVLASYLEHSIIDAKGGPCWISTHVAQSLREIVLRTRPVSARLLELADDRLRVEAFKNESLLSLVLAFKNAVPPAPFEANGKRYEFVPPDPALYLRQLRSAIEQAEANEQVKQAERAARLREGA
jgi:hypothetical protein